MAVRRAELRAYGELGDFLPPGRRGRAFEVTFELPRGVRDLVQSVGIPHPEVDVVVVNEQPVGWDRRVDDGDRVAVYPRFFGVDIAGVSPVHEPLPEPIAFALDAHLGRLARYLRMLGFDAWWERDVADDQLVTVADRHRRVLLTRDRGVLFRSEVRWGSYVRTSQPDDQMVEVVRRFGIGDRIRPFTRCMACNGELEDADPADLPPRTRATEASRCVDCGRLLWEGSHTEAMRELIALARWGGVG